MKDAGLKKLKMPSPQPSPGGRGDFFGDIFLCSIWAGVVDIIRFYL
jgi:hypothetical protein